MCEGTPINVYLKEMKILADKLALIGSPVSEEDQVVTLLGSLPTSFTTIITALEAMLHSGHSRGGCTKCDKLCLRSRQSNNCWFFA